MTNRRTVLELILTAALRVEVPIEYGDELREGVYAVLGEIAGVRHVALEELGDVARENDHLCVETYVRITVHLDPKTVDDPEQLVRDRLVGGDVVSSVQNFQIASGPYPIESW